jgi:hypothetical protein
MSFLPKMPMKGERVIHFAKQTLSWMRANRITDVIGGKMKQTPNGLTLDVRPSRKTLERATIKPPLWVTLYKTPDDIWKIYVQDGKVVTRSNATGDAIGTLSITSLPTEAAPVTVTKDDKLSIKLDIDSDGQVTAATFEQTSSPTPWPESVAPILQGGDRQGENIPPAADDAKGSVGEHYIRLAEITELQAAAGNDPQVLGVTRFKTGHVDHFQPMLAENCITSLGTWEANVLQKFDTTGGEWKLRTLAGAYGGGAIGFTEDTDRLRANTLGDTFKVDLWQTDITLITPAPETLEIDNGADPLAEFWVLDGVWFTSEPTGFPGTFTTFNFSYVTPTTGGP